MQRLLAGLLVRDRGRSPLLRRASPQHPACDQRCCCVRGARYCAGSAETEDTYSPAEEEGKEVIPKTEDERNIIRSALKKTEIFSHCTDEQYDFLVTYATSLGVEVGEVVIQQVRGPSDRACARARAPARLRAGAEARCRGEMACTVGGTGRLVARRRR